MLIHSFLLSTLAEILLAGRAYLLQPCGRLGLEGGHDVVPVFRNVQVSGVGPLFMLAVRTDEFCWNMAEEDFTDRVMLTRDLEGQVQIHQGQH